jgi:ribulose-5-phosphate 4-epimerase/fuculose-1-phosphate aldolase
VLDAYGHVSVRDPENPKQFIMSRARAPELVTEDDLMTFDAGGQPVGEDKRGPYQERFIHAAVFEARPDVMVVCHAHTPSVIPFGVTDVPMRPVFHQGAVIGGTIPVWDIAADFGDTNMLVTNMDQGRSLAKTLADGKTVLMRGHGCVFVGRTVPNIVSHGVYMNINAQMLTAAHLMSGGKVHTLSDGEVHMRTVQPGGPAAGAGAPAAAAGGGGAGGGREWEAWCIQVGITDA